MAQQEKGKGVGRLIVPPTAEEAIALCEAISGKTLSPKERQAVEEGFEAMFIAEEEEEHKH